MKKLMFACFALSLVLWVAAESKASAQQGSSQQNQTDQAQGNSRGNQNMSGSVSANGKSFVNDKDNKKYKVDNPEALQGHDGQHVAVIVHVDPDTGVLHIMQVEVPDKQ